MELGVDRLTENSNIMEEPYGCIVATLFHTMYECVNTCLSKEGNGLCTVLVFVSGLIKEFPPSHETRTKVYGCAGSGGFSWF